MPATSELRRLCSGRAWVKATAGYRAACAATGAPCGICGQPIDYSLTGNHKRAFTVDHVIPLWSGQNPNPLDPAGWRPAHRTCNSSRGARENAKRRYTRPHPPLITSTRW